MIMSAFSARVYLLILGDVLTYIFSLVLTLLVRYGEVPTRDLFLSHIGAFSVLFVLFIVIGLIVGVYDKQSSFINGGRRGVLMRMQLVSIILGVAFFYLAPVAITPKVNLFLFFTISTILLYTWRMVILPVLSAGKKTSVVLVGSGSDIEDLYTEVNGRGGYGLFFKAKILPSSSVAETERSILTAVEAHRASVVVADLRNPAVESAMPSLYKLIFNGVQIVDASSLYENIFDRIPLYMVGERWLVENSTTAVGSRRTYDALKRTMDIVAATILGIVSLVVYPFVWLAIKLEDGGNIFVTQERVGKNGRLIKMTKFRSMTADDSGAYGTDGKTKLKVTRVGKFLRMSRTDELPQLWSVLVGDQSLIGPRPEFPSLVSIYDKEVPYYSARHLIKPGLSGWAQIYHQAHPHHAVAIDDTRNKLSYDLYYVKNRSLMLDIRIALQTLRAFISRQGV